MMALDKDMPERSKYIVNQKVARLKLEVQKSSAMSYHKIASNYHVYKAIIVDLILVKSLQQKIEVS